MEPNWCSISAMSLTPKAIMERTVTPSLVFSNVAKPLCRINHLLLFEWWPEAGWKALGEEWECGMSEKADTGVRVNKKPLLRENVANNSRQAFESRLCLELFSCVFWKINIFSSFRNTIEFSNLTDVLRSCCLFFFKSSYHALQSKQSQITFNISLLINFITF